MSEIQKVKMLVISLDGKNVALPLWQWAMLEDLDVMEDSLRVDVAEAKELARAKRPVAFYTSNYIPAATSSDVTFSYNDVTVHATGNGFTFNNRLTQEDIGKMMWFGSTCEKIGIIRSVNTWSNTVTVRLLQQ